MSFDLLRKRPSPAMIVALLALFVALGGSSYAAVKISARDIKSGAVGTRAIANNSVRSGDIRNATITGADVQDDSLSNADIDNSSLAAATAKNADTAAQAAHATSATTATSAGNADKLDNLDSSDFTRPACTSQTGALKGSVTIAASAGFSGSFTPVPGYNCSGQSIEARRLSMGRYELRFNGSPATQAVATAIVAGIKADMISVTNNGAGLFTVYVLDPLPAPGAFVDDSFTVITP
jgi:outer membrane protein assembly factor BamE (lipoprotein component of BamABCDE complex)